ncbi:UPF0688 protein C1orf174 homolog [Calypte anna]|nr:UPF0688 protein C1orf174 homolog [Calypte anna]
MAAGSTAGAPNRSRTGTRGPALSGRQRLPGRRRPPGSCAKGSLESRQPAAASAQPAGEALPATPGPERSGPRTPSPPSSHKVADRRRTKRLKCEKNSPGKSELEGLKCGSGNLAALGETPKTSDGDQCSEDPGDSNTVPEKKSENIPETDEDKQQKEGSVPLKPNAVKSSDASSVMDSDEDLCNRGCGEDESSCVSSDGSSSEDGDLPEKPTERDNSTFLDEDSNQPMPVARFFGDVELLRDLPAAALPSTAMSRREFRKLHFIAKEEEEEEEEDVV